MMIQDIDPYKYNVEYKDINPQDNDFIIMLIDDRIPVKRTENSIEFPIWAHAKAIIGGYTGNYAVRYLFEIEGAGKFFCIHQFSAVNDNDAEQKLTDSGFELLNQRQVQSSRPRWAAFAGTTAFHFALWYQQNRFCGKCGEPMTLDSKERMIYCEKCRIPVYPRINPVVIVGITDGDRILLVKYAEGGYHRYCLVAGFMEVGESVEDAVKREVFEEVGLKVNNIRYYMSQPWAMSGSMILGVYCDLVGSDEVTFNDGELSVAQWFDRKDVPYGDEGISVTSELMNGFIEGKDEICK